MTDCSIIAELYDRVKSRKMANPKVSYSAKLFRKGRLKIAQKLGEEAVETVIEATANNKKETIEESADLLYHLLVLWAEMDIKPEKVMRELEKRKGKSGIEEKKARQEKEDD